MVVQIKEKIEKSPLKQQIFERLFQLTFHSNFGSFNIPTKSDRNI